MKKSIILSALLLHAVFAFAQRDRFELIEPKEKIASSRYNKITYVESRVDLNNLGIIQLGPLNKKTIVKPESPLSQQVTKLFGALVDSSAKEGELLFQLRLLSFAEVTGAFSEKGYCHFRANLYEKKDQSYYKISYIDTVVIFTSVEVTQAILRRGSAIITSFIADNLRQESVDNRPYSHADIVNIDALEKKYIPVYAATTYKDGLYFSYESFANQVPDMQVSPELKGNRVKAVRAPDKNGKMKPVKNHSYALVHGGRIWLKTEYGFYPAKNLNGDFVFKGKTKANARTGDVVLASMFFGVIGGLIASNANAVFEMRIDHLTGGFIRVKEVRAR